MYHLVDNLFALIIILYFSNVCIFAVCYMNKELLNTLSIILFTVHVYCIIKDQENRSKRR